MESNKEVNDNSLFKTALGIAATAAGAVGGAKVHGKVKGAAKSANISTKDMYKRIGKNVKDNYKDIGKIADKGASDILGTTRDSIKYATNSVGEMPLSHIGGQVKDAYVSDLRGMGSELKDILKSETKINPNAK